MLLAFSDRSRRVRPVHRNPEEAMRIAVLLTTLLCCATVAHAQQANLEAPAENPVPVAVAEVNAEMDAATTELAPVQVEAQTTVTGSNAEAAMQPATPMNWWWLVGAIVIAGIILAVIL
jgi:microcystin-dependent protein